MRALRDVQHAVRTLARSPAFTSLVVLTLALGIGASAAIFSIVNAVVLRPLDYPEPDRLVRVTSELRRFGAADTGITAAELRDYQERGDLFAGVAGMLPVSANVTGGGTPERAEVMLVSWNYFSILGVPPTLGRVFGPEDDTPGVANVAVVSDAFWRRRLSADTQAIGRAIVVDDDPVVVVGVMPPEFRHPGRTVQAEVDVWSPAGFRNDGAGESVRSRRRLEGGLARLQPGITVEGAQARLAEHGVAIAARFPADYPPENGWRPRVVPLQQDLLGNVARPMFVLLCGVGLLLLVACANVAHLVLARAHARRPEMAVRRALGAGGLRLTWELAVESALLAAAGGALGVLVASWGLRALLALAPPRVPRLDTVTVDVAALGVAAGICLAVTALFAVLPAVQARRGDVFATLKEGGSGRGTDGRAGRARSALVVAEVAMATVLLVGAGLFVRTVTGLLSVPVGFETSNLLTARITLPRPNDADKGAYLDPARRAAFYQEALGRIQALPGVERAAMSSQIPLGGFNPPLFVEIERSAPAGPGARPVAHHFQVSPDYFETMRIAIVKGRAFDETDRAGGVPVGIVGETAARIFWPDRDPLGERLRLAPGAPWITVVGVAADVLHRRLTEGPQPLLYRPLDQSSDLTMGVLVRTRGDASRLGEHLVREVRAVDPALPVYAIRRMEELLETAVAQRRFLMRLLAAFGTVATGLALLGIYGVMAYSVSQRTREIAIRMAIGARQSDMARMVIRRAAMLTAAGVVIGMVTSVALSGLVRSQLFGVQPADPATILAVVTLMTAVAGLAAYLPARRASRVDPVSALRAQ
jgi:putative ABC transport system permease protein